jgi:hypothetical protein
MADREEIAAVLPIVAAAHGLDAAAVPATALIREFIGDSVYHH